MTNEQRIPFRWTHVAQAVAVCAIVGLLWEARGARDDGGQRIAALEQRLVDLSEQQSQLTAATRQSALASARTQVSLASVTTGSAGEEVQNTLMQEVQHCEQLVEAAAQEKAPLQPRPPAPAERVQEAQGIVDRVLSRRKVTAEDADRLRFLRTKYPDDPELKALREELVIAINEQRLVPDIGAVGAF
jgi:hypothetical protein